MSIEQITASLVVLLLLAYVAEPISRIVRLPYCSVLVIVGFIASEVAVMSGLDTGIRAENFHDLIFYVFIPVLVFESAYRIDKRLLADNIGSIIFLAVIGLFLTASLAAVGLFFGIAHPTGFPFIAAMLTGAILAATDPVAVVSRLREIGAPERLTVLLEGESLFNDATAIVLFSLFVSMALSLDSAVTPSQVITEFLRIFLGGLATGAVVGLAAGLSGRIVKGQIMNGMLSLIVAYGAYLLADGPLEVSGVMATLSAAIVMSLLRVDKPLGDADKKHDYMWDVIAHIANATVFIIMGVTVTLSMFEERWLAMLIAIVAVLVARAVSVYGSLSLLGLMQSRPVDLRSQTVMVWGGLRGAVALALALSIPVSLDYWWTIQSIAFGVVLFALFIQAPTIRWLVDRLDIRGRG
ncbi:MAG: sodium:proton antiporter [Thiotrichales bacterium]|nr:MAG: sodium:proton antiporter [Thiotrichales bacterium]